MEDSSSTILFYLSINRVKWVNATYLNLCLVASLGIAPKSRSSLLLYGFSFYSSSVLLMDVPDLMGALFDAGYALPNKSNDSKMK
jgi:hypothetical protein